VAQLLLDVYGDAAPWRHYGPCRMPAFMDRFGGEPKRGKMVCERGTGGRVKSMAQVSEMAEVEVVADPTTPASDARTGSQPDVQSWPGESKSRTGGNGTWPVSEIEKHVVAGLGRRSVVLVGLMGCGKSSVGRKLSQRLALPFVDADDEIERAANKTIPEIFSEHGEPYFRDGERRVIARLLRSGPQVLATGGGAFMNEITRHAVKGAGLSVWLRAELPLLMKRVAKRQNRPLLKSPDPEGAMRRFIEVRYPVYALADVVVDSRDVSHDVMADAVIRAISESGAL
jgi:shikimate kinase